jgi:CrcB protein
MLTIAVGLAAAAGALLRYLLDRSVSRTAQRRVQRRVPVGPLLPWGTFIINVSGSLGLGLLTGLSLHHGLGPDPLRILGAGLFGGYTTWSTFMWESFALAEQRHRRPATANVVGSLMAGLGAAAAGLGLALL